MRIRTYDCGYALAIMFGTNPDTAQVFTFRFPFPLTLKSWKYLWKHRHAN